MLGARLLLLSAALLGPWWPSVATWAQVRAVDVEHSVAKVRVYKSGLFSALAHDHEIEARFAEGTVHFTANPSVALTLHARDLRVLDTDVSAKDRAQIQKTMEGPEVLDMARFPEISFQSKTVETRDAQHWVVRGNLTLHGQSSPVEVDVVLRDNRYEGFAKLKQRDFGMTPVSIAGGTVKVKDEVRVEFNIVLKP